MLTDVRARALAWKDGGGVMHVCVRAYVGCCFSVRVFFFFSVVWLLGFSFFFVFVSRLAGAGGFFRCFVVVLLLSLSLLTSRAA